MRGDNTSSLSFLAQNLQHLNKFLQSSNSFQFVSLFAGKGLKLFSWIKPNIYFSKKDREKKQKNKPGLGGRGGCAPFRVLFWVASSNNSAAGTAGVPRNHGSIACTGVEGVVSGSFFPWYESEEEHLLLVSYRSAYLLSINQMVIILNEDSCLQQPTAARESKFFKEQQMCCPEDVYTHPATTMVDFCTIKGRQQSGVCSFLLCKDFCIPLFSLVPVMEMLVNS